jgi:hypothetical protein
MAVELKVLGPIPIIEKNLGGAEDFLLGDGTVTQTRNGQEVTVTRFGAGSIPWIGTPGETPVTTIREYFEAFYLGAHPTDPVTDNLGRPLVDGAMYLNTTETPPVVKVFSTAIGWGTVITLTNLATINGESLMQPIDFELALQSDLDTLYEAVANLAIAQGAIANESTPALVIDTTPQILPFVVATESTNTDVFSFDAIANTMTFKKDIVYNFTSSLTLTSAVGFTVQITFNIINVADDSVVKTQTVPTNIQSGRTETIPLNTLVTLPAGTAPITVRVEAVADFAGYTLVQFNSILAASGGAAALLPSQGAHAGEFLTTDGTNTSWAKIPDVPIIPPSVQLATI